VRDAEEAGRDEETERERLSPCCGRSAELQDKRLSERHLLIPWSICGEIIHHWLKRPLAKPIAVKGLLMLCSSNGWLLNDPSNASNGDAAFYLGRLSPYVPLLRSRECAFDSKWALVLFWWDWQTAQVCFSVR